jgi:hypothetical protein
MSDDVDWGQPTGGIKVPPLPRTDPWRWYCRLCGAAGDAATEVTRSVAAHAHLRETKCGQGTKLGWNEAGRLVHIWTYGR